MATPALIQSLYQGTVYSNPVAWQAGQSSATASGLMSSQDASNVASTLTIYFEHSFDGGKSFNSGAEAAWVGGGTQPNGSVAYPSLLESFPPNGLPTHTRVRVQSPNVLSFGFNVAVS
jgi:hypothetical protein